MIFLKSPQCVGFHRGDLIIIIRPNLQEVLDFEFCFTGNLIKSHIKIYFLKKNSNLRLNKLSHFPFQISFKIIVCVQLHMPH